FFLDILNLLIWTYLILTLILPIYIKYTNIIIFYKRGTSSWWLLTTPKRNN
ncbi:hypothetical protein ACJX0J_020273, partial [Zea mays]